jgi:hypothetical protein
MGGVTSELGDCGHLAEPGTEQEPEQAPVAEQPRPLPGWDATGYSAAIAACNRALLNGVPPSPRTSARVAAAATVATAAARAATDDARWALRARARALVHAARAVGAVPAVK